MNGSGITYEDVILAQSREEKEQLKKKLETHENVIKEAIKLIDYYGITPEQNDNVTK